MLFHLWYEICSPPLLLLFLPLFLFASVYEYPCACPVFRPKSPQRFGPVLCFPPFSTVWHWAHFWMKIFLPASGSPILFCRGTVNHRAKEISDLQNWGKKGIASLAELIVYDAKQIYIVYIMHSLMPDEYMSICQHILQNPVL